MFDADILKSETKGSELRGIGGVDEFNTAATGDMESDLKNL